MHWFFFFNDTATTEIYTLSLHDALPISPRIDCPLRKQLTEIANDELTRLHSLYSQSSAKIHIGEHNLQCSSPTQTAALFGAKGNGRYDGWHLYGDQGVRRYTESVLNILCEAGVALKSSTKASHPTVTPAPSPDKPSAPHPDHNSALPSRSHPSAQMSSSIKVKSKPCMVKHPPPPNFTHLHPLPTTFNHLHPPLTTCIHFHPSPPTFASFYHAQTSPSQGH